jgi:uncharacterized protein
MTTYLSPGVYVEETLPSARPIAGVGTSTGGFVGVVPNTVTMPFRPGSDTDRVPVASAGEPQFITSWEEFKNSFGDIQANNKTLALAVYGFFNNGGTSCWVTRVVAVAGITTTLSNTLESFEPIDDIAIVAVPGATSPTQHEAIMAHCEKMKDRFAILDAIESPAAVEEVAIRGGTAGENGTSPTRDSEYAAMYFPWIKVFDPVTDSLVNQPPSGHIAGVYARVDGERGVFKAPANEVIRGAMGMERMLSKGHRDKLNPTGINVIRGFGGNIKIWGARTLGGKDNVFPYISTRRYMNFLRESIDEGTQWVVFEPNTPDLWQRITRTVEDFLLVQWQTGGLFGETPKKAFFVKCDHDTNPPQLRELGQVVTEIGVAIVKPAEFVIFRIQQLTGS